MTEYDTDDLLAQGMNFNRSLYSAKILPPAFITLVNPTWNSYAEDSSRPMTLVFNS